MLLLLLVIAAYGGITYYYQFNVKPNKELKAFTGENRAYPFVDGQFQIPANRFSDFEVLNLDSTDMPNFQNLAYLDSKRKTISLNGEWQIAEGDFENMPTEFNHTAPVPGFADLANPAFDGVGDTEPLIGLGAMKPSQIMTAMRFQDKKREAFWYKKVFKIEGAIPAFAQLKVHRAQYGSAVWLNGEKLGENGRNYQPGYYDATNTLKGNGEENELIIRVGTSVTYSQNNQNIYGDALEKDRHLPGIYDDVALRLSGGLQIEKVQVIPNIQNQTAKVIAWVKNKGVSTSTSLHFDIKKYQTDSIVGAVETTSFNIKEKETKLVEVEIPIKNCQLWSPENPALYTLNTQSENDELATRFGMREFYFDETTKVPTLNNKPYYLRGTSVPFFRYIENPYRKDEVWKEEWVRTVFQRFKEMNWNSVRFHVGSAPSMWYRIADEEGMIIQDEYAVWGYHLFQMGIPLDTLVNEYIGWMEEQWNHASLLIWDAQNETTQAVDPRTGMAMKMVRSLDLSNRPWDNGWGDIDKPTDTKEVHPYVYSKAMFSPMGGELPDLPTLAQFNDTNPDSTFLSEEGNPVLVNEYSWLWVRRDGKPTDLTEAGYAKYFPNATPEESFERYAYDCAAQTEYYRALRSAGVMQFAGLSSNYEGCKTTDIFSNIDNLTIEPFIKKYVKDAFSPLGICLFDWSDDFEKGSKKEIPIVLVNDTYEDWEGAIEVEILKDNQTVWQKSFPAKVVGTGKTIEEITLEMPNETGDYQMTASIQNQAGETISSKRKFHIK